MARRCSARASASTRSTRSSSCSSSNDRSAWSSATSRRAARCCGRSTPSRSSSESGQSADSVGLSAGHERSSRAALLPPSAANRRRSSKAARRLLRATAGKNYCGRQRVHGRCRGLVPHLWRAGAGGCLGVGRAAVARGRPPPTCVLSLLDRADVTATCFVLGWVAERHPDVVARIRAAGHEIGSPRLRPSARLRARPRRRSTPTCAPASAALVAAGAPTAAPVSRARMVDQRSRALGARPARAARLRGRFEPRADVDRRQSRLSAAAAHIDTPAGPARRSAAVRHPPVRPVDAVRRRLGPAHVAAGPHPRGNRAAQRAPAIPSPSGSTPGSSIPIRRGCACRLATSFAHYFRLDGLAGRLEEVLRGASFGTMGADARVRRGRAIGRQRLEPIGSRLDSRPM